MITDAVAYFISNLLNGLILAMPPVDIPEMPAIPAPAFLFAKDAFYGFSILLGPVLVYRFVASFFQLNN